MQKVCSYIPLVLLFICFGCSESDGTLEIPAIDPIEEDIQSIVDSKTGPDKLIGVTLSIRQGDSEKWLFSGGNSKQGEPMQTGMKFGIASITKTAVAAAILKLEEEGLIGLEDPIDKFLDLDSDHIDGSITIFQLLNHYSGLKGYFHHPDIWPRVESALDMAIPSEELAAYIGAPNFAPGQRFEYSNSNYLILGLIIKEVSGMSVGSYLRSRFWQPLQLRDTYFGTDEQIPGQVADAWRDTDGDGSLENITDQYGPAYHSVFFTAADLFTTASDLSLWAQHLYAGEALLPESLEKMMDIITIDSGSPYWNGYGLGVRRFFIAGRLLYGHTGGMRGYGSYMLYDPISGLSIALLNNQSRSENGPLLRFELMEEVLNLLFDKV